MNTSPSGTFAVDVVLVRSEAEPVPLILSGGELGLHPDAGNHGSIAGPELNDDFELSVLLKIVVDDGIAVADSEAEVEDGMIAFGFDIFGGGLVGDIIPRVQLEGEFGSLVIVDGRTPEVEMKGTGEEVLAVEFVREKAAI